MTRVLAVLGSVTPPGRLRAALRLAVETAAASPGVSASLLDLAEHRVSFADGRPLDRFADDTARVVAQIAEADAVLLASPVYRASFSGALKNLLDLVPLEALEGKPVGIMAMGATPHHYLGVDGHLRAVLAWFGALTAPTSVYLESAHFKDGDLADPGARRAVTDLVGALLTLATSRAALGPRPLAARG